MAVTKKPAYLHRQKEQHRIARVAEIREARLARKHSGGAGIEDPDALDPLVEEPEVDEEGTD